MYTEMLFTAHDIRFIAINNGVWVIFENTHKAIIDQKSFDIVQRSRWAGTVRPLARFSCRA